MGKVFLAVVLALALTGCGGGGGGGNAIPTGNVTRQWQAGDHLTYTVTGTAGEGDESVPVAGTMTFTVTSPTGGEVWTPMYGNRILKLTMELDARFGGQPILVANIAYVEQDANGTLYTVGNDDGETFEFLESATSPPIAYPGTLAVGQAYSYIATWNDGSGTSTEQVSGVVVSLEPMAGRMAYKVHETRVDEDGTTSSDEWFVPDLGYGVKEIGTLQVGTVRLSIATTLSSKNF